MRFGPVPLQEAEGAILAHSEATPTGRLRKGQVLGPGEIAALAAAGLREVTVARLDADDVAEDTAAARLAEALVPDEESAGLDLTPAFTGRVNLKARSPGVLAVDAEKVNAFNRVHPAITLATLPHLARVATGQLCATVKVIAYAVPEAAIREASAVGTGALHRLPVVRRSAGLIMTEVPGQDRKLDAKGKRAIEGRLRALGMDLAAVRAVPHEIGDVAAALRDLPGEIALILTGSATSDLYDTAPEGLRRAGGTVTRFGMPVDPGNLLFIGQLAGRPVIGLPGCARSPALNGADWVLERLACGIEVTGEDIARMGVGGLLKEIAIRPQARDPA